MSSVIKPRSKFLGTLDPRRAEKFLLKLANIMPMNPDAALNIQKRYPEICACFGTDIIALGSALNQMQFNVQRAWKAPDARHRDWYLYELRRAYRDEMVQASYRRGETTPPPIMRTALTVDGHEVTIQQTDDRLVEPPPITILEAVVYYFQLRIADFAKFCGNTGCPAPYFIAEKRWQRYCTLKCAAPALREQKAEWWRKNRAKNGGTL